MNPIDVKVCVNTSLLPTPVVTTDSELVTLVNTVDCVGSGWKSWSSMILSLVSGPPPPPPDPTIVQSVITPHPVKFIVGMMYCVLAGKVPPAVLPTGGKEGTSQVPDIHERK